MRRKTKDAVNKLALGICAAGMLVLGTWLPPIVEAPPAPRIRLEEV